MEPLLTIGQISKLFGITTETLRHYDRIGLLKPIIHPSNGYRYYSIKELELLELIVEAKYLEIPLSNIKDIIHHGNIESYVKLIELQENTIDEKITHLQKTKELIREKKNLLHQILQFENIYDFQQLDIQHKTKHILYLPIENISTNKVQQIDSSSKSLYFENWISLFEVNDSNQLIENTTYLGIDIHDTTNLTISKDKRIYDKCYVGKCIEVQFLGDLEELEAYVLSMLSYFAINPRTYKPDIGVKFLWSHCSNVKRMYFTQIFVPLE